jgi:hypothetical protein
MIIGLQLFGIQLVEVSDWQVRHERRSGPSALPAGYGGIALLPGMRLRNGDCAARGQS